MGGIYAGDPLVLGADWWIRIDDSTWPPLSNPQARWDYLFNNFATYDANSFSWTIVFDEASCGTKPVWRSTMRRTAKWAERSSSS
ncbi:MAG: hypothetical protein MZU95_00650 [Desulfomicrobium escambiense]|nr:hypothetical protein [Desulfomicrobium escambiense]